jgi:hypothetical protein
METIVKPYKGRKEVEAVLRNCVGHHLTIPNLRSSGLPGSRPRLDRGFTHHRAALSSLRLRTFNEFKQLTVSSFFVQCFDSDTITLIPVLLHQHANGVGVRVLAGACGLSRYSCGNPKLSRRDADDPLEVKRKMTLVREAAAERDLRQTELTVSPQEVLRSFNAAHEHILVRRQAGGRLFVRSFLLPRLSAAARFSVCVFTGIQPSRVPARDGVISVPTRS